MHLRLEQHDSRLGPLLLVTDDDGVLRALEFADHELRMQRLLREHYGDYVLHQGAAPASVKRRWTLTSTAKSMHSPICRSQPEARSSSAKCGGRCGRFLPERHAVMDKLPFVSVAPAPAAPSAPQTAQIPVPIVVPCHRVIGANGALTGYGGGLPRKRWLLDHERRFSGAEDVDVELGLTSTAST